MTPIPLGILASAISQLVPIPAGYWGWQTGADKIVWADESRVTLSPGLSSGGNGASGFASLENGYLLNGDYRSTADKFSFANDSRTTLTVIADGYSIWGGSGWESLTHGYSSSGGGTLGNRLNKFSFATDTGTIANSSIGHGTGYTAAFASSVAGYVGGGYLGGTRITKVLFSNDSASAIGATMATSNLEYPGAFSSSSAGYWAGGAPDQYPDISQISKLNFSNDSRSVLGTTLAGNRAYTGGTESLNAGYVGGGIRFTPSFANLSSIEKLNYSNESRSVLGATLSAAKNSVGAMSLKG